MLCARDETSEEEMQKKTEERFMSLFVTFFSRFLFSYEQEEKLKKRNTTQERERERERTHALIITLDFLSSSSLICIKEIERKSG